MEIIKELTPHLKILEKVESFEKKAEFNRFLLVVTFAGFVTMIGGFLDYVSYRIVGTGTTYFIFDITGISNEIVLFFFTWIIYLVPILIIIIFSTGSPGFINWNRSYRLIGFTAIFLFIINQLLILLIGEPNAQFIPVIWGSTVCIGFILAHFILRREITNKKLLTGLLAFGVLAFIVGFVSSFLIQLELSMLFFSSTIGLFLSVSGFITYLNVGKFGVPIDEE